MSHRPVLSAFSMVCFGAGLTVCIYTRVRSKRNQDFQRRLKIRRAIRSKKRKQQQEREEEVEEEGEEREGRLRRRLGHAEEEEESDSGADSKEDEVLETDKTK